MPILDKTLETNHSSAAGTACQVAARTAAIAAVFCLLVGTLLFYDYSHRQWKDPLEATAIKALKAALAEQPANDALKEQIRALDQEVRQEYFRQRAFAASGGILLLGGLVVFLAAARVAATLRRKLPMPAAAATAQDIESQWTPLARWAVAGLGVVLLAIAGGLIAGFRGGVPISDEGPVASVEGSAARLAAVQAGGPAQPAMPSPAAKIAPVAVVLPKAPTEDEIAKAWPRFRGPGGAGISAYSNVPDTWDGPTGKNILWKTPVPLAGNNSPVVWGQRVFLSGADERQHEVYCFDTADGKLLWHKEVPTTAASSKPPKVNADTGFASPTVATDGRLVFAIFANGDVGAFDFAGKLVWSRSLGVPDNNYGHAASLATFHDLLLVPMDQGTSATDKSKTLALDMATGNTVWQQKRKALNSWSSPIVIRAAGHDQLITTCDPWVIAYELPSGAELWRAKCVRGEVGPSPVAAGGIVYVAGSESSPLCAVAADGKGDVTESKLLWRGEDGLPDTCSPLATEKYVFLLTSFGTLTCYEAKQGEKLWEEDLDAKFKASPGLAGNRLYLIAEDGKAVLVEPGEKGCKRVGEAALGEPCVSSPAFQDGRIYLRGQKNLFCIGKK
jgi:outer membrane protein assembly factor BamB